jgi:hypothetical protein
MNCTKLRFSISLTIDLCMLYFAVMSIYPYLSKSDNIICRRFNDSFSLSANIELSREFICNIPFHLLFYLATITHDSEKNINLVYEY